MKYDVQAAGCNELWKLVMSMYVGVLEALHWYEMLCRMRLIMVGAKKMHWRYMLDHQEY
jgi:hypothetical protein